MTATVGEAYRLRRAAPTGRPGAGMVRCVDDDLLLALCHRAVDAVPLALAPVEDWRPRGERPGQYAIDLVADRAVLAVLDEAGIGVVSEESGVHRAGAPLVAVVDPVDGSTNASRGIAFYASSICVLDAAGPRVSVVANLASGVRYHAVRGGGAWRGTTRVVPSGSRRCARRSSASRACRGGISAGRNPGLRRRGPRVVCRGRRHPRRVRRGDPRQPGPLGLPGRHARVRRSRCRHERLQGRELVTQDPDARRAVVAAATKGLLGQLESAAAAEQ